MVTTVGTCFVAGVYESVVLGVAASVMVGVRDGRCRRGRGNQSRNRRRRLRGSHSRRGRWCIGAKELF